jgi:hypothetical protein
VTVNVPLPPGTRAKNLDVVMTPKKLKASEVVAVTDGRSKSRARLSRSSRETCSRILFATTRRGPLVRWLALLC